MKIDRSNYEIWFIDWLDGNLNEIQADQLILFLAENPDLREELEELSEFRITPPGIVFPGKNRLKKSAADITGNQFDYLCTAAIENDLSEEEMMELTDIISSDIEKNNILELYRKTILIPPDIKYRNKRKLLKSTPVQKILRISFAGLSAAASIAILIVASFYLTGKDFLYNNNHSQLMNEGRALHSGIPIPSYISAWTIQKKEIQDLQNQSVTVNDLTIKAGEGISKVDFNNTPSTEDVIPVKDDNIVSLAVIPRYSDVTVFNDTYIDNNLEQIDFSIPSEPVDQWSLGKFIAKSFREKILKEDTADESPIKVYEIAEAGVTGINRLLGWQMAFEKNSDQNGDVKSVYFSSKILKIQTPVNKTEIAE